MRPLLASDDGDSLHDGADEPDELDVASADFRPDIPLLNTVILTGRLGRDPILRHVGGDADRKLALLTFSLAVADEFPEGEWDEGAERTTSWFNCELWGKRAETGARLLRKGLRVGVNGQLGFSTYQNRDGRDVDSAVIMVSSFEILQSKSERDGNESSSPGSYAPPSASRFVERRAQGYDPFPESSAKGGATASRQAPVVNSTTDEDDDLPF
jgi:single-strand DNA-binding protein